jgi:hypothetical protein
MAKEIDLNRRVNGVDLDDRSAESIRGDIAATRENIADTVDKLTDRVQETLDWRSYVERHPYAAVGVAAGAGLLLSGMFKKQRKNPTERMLEALAESVEDTTDRLRGAISFLPRGGLRPGNAVKAAVVGLLARKASEYFEERLSRPAQTTVFGDDDRRHAAAAGLQPQYEQQDISRRNHGTDDERFS